MVSKSSEPLRIVVVDDDSQIREVVGRCLVLFGASVTLCEDVVAAVEAIKRVRPDVVLVGEGADERWALGHAEVAAALRGYRPVETVDGVEIWLPRNDMRTGPP